MAMTDFFYFSFAKIDMYWGLPDKLPSQVNVSIKLHIFSSYCALARSDGGEKKKEDWEKKQDNRE